MTPTDHEIEIDRQITESDGRVVEVRLWFDDAGVRGWHYRYRLERGQRLIEHEGELDKHRAVIGLAKLRQRLLQVLPRNHPVPTLGWERDSEQVGWVWRRG